MDSASKRVVIDTGELDSWPPSTNDTLAIAELFAKRQLLAQWRDRCIKLEQELEVAREQCMRLEQEIYVTNQEPLVVSSAHGALLIISLFLFSYNE